VALAVGHLVDPDPLESVEPVAGPGGGVLVDDPLDHPPDRVPVDAHQGGDRRLRGGLGQGDAGVLEGACEARSGPGPRHRLRADPAGGTRDAAGLAADDAPDPPEVQMPPAHRPGVVGAAHPRAAARAAHRPPRSQGEGDDDPLGVLLLHQLDADDPWPPSRSSRLNSVATRIWCPRLRFREKTRGYERLRTARGARSQADLGRIRASGHPLRPPKSPLSAAAGARLGRVGGDLHRRGSARRARRPRPGPRGAGGHLAGDPLSRGRA
jgi:hypothetical protein